MRTQMETSELQTKERKIISHFRFGLSVFSRLFLSANVYVVRIFQQYTFLLSIFRSRALLFFFYFSFSQFIFNSFCLTCRFDHCHLSLFRLSIYLLKFCTWLSLIFLFFHYYSVFVSHRGH